MQTSPLTVRGARLAFSDCNDKYGILIASCPLRKIWPTLRCRVETKGTNTAEQMNILLINLGPGHATSPTVLDNNAR